MSGDAKPKGLVPSLPPSEAVAAGLSDASGVDLGVLEVESLSEGLSEERLKERARIAEFGRNEKFRNHFERLAVLGLWASAIAIVAISGVWLFHLMAPTTWRWLQSDDLATLQGILTAGILVGVVGNHFRKRLD